MRKFLVACALAGALMPLAACGSDDDDAVAAPPPTETEVPANEPTVNIQGQDFTCGQIITRPDQQVVPCGAGIQAVFNEWGQNIDTYANGDYFDQAFGSGTLAYEDIVYIGLVACALQAQDDSLFELQEYTDEASLNVDLEFLRVAWGEASRNLCLTGYEGNGLPHGYVP